jgi:hypothetical protein
MTASWILPRVGEHAMSISLREVSDPDTDEFIIMVMDGAGRHKAKALYVPGTVPSMTGFTVDC